MKNQLIILALLFSTLFAYSQVDTTITTFNQVHQTFGNGLNTRTVVDTFYFPSDLSDYSAISINIQLDCPSGGCDPWDRFANLKIVHQGEAFEIARYMTPYGKGCGWTVDLSDYRSMLTDTVILSSFIDTWVNPAWLVSYDFTFTAGTPNYEYIKVTNLWNDENVVYGDTTKPISLDSVYHYISPFTSETFIRVVNTGHGQGNTDNAAEFSQKTHKIYVDDVNLYSHLLWRSDCSDNPGCSNQAGTWTYNRANWCPGKAVDVEDFDLTSDVTAGELVKFEYELENYFNQCSPNTDACIQGTTCTDCNYNYNGHTQPHYKIHIQLLQKSNDSDVLINNIDDLNSTIITTLFPNPTSGIINLGVIIQGDQDVEIMIFSTLGNLVYSEKRKSTSNFNTQIDLSNQPTGLYFVTLKTESGTITKKVALTK